MTTEAPPRLTVAGLTVTHPSGDGRPARSAVNGVTFTIQRGEVLGLVGASGSGKSTILHALAGLSGPGTAVTADRLELDGIDLRSLDRGGWVNVRRAHLGLIPQQPMTALTPAVGVGRQLDWYLGPDAVIRHADQLGHMGLDCVVERPHDLPGRFSGGQLQRLLIALNTLGTPRSLLLADEPTSTLDVTVQSTILERLHALRNESDISMVIVSHDLAVVAHTADRVGVIHEGSLVELAPVAQLFEDPAHPTTRALVASVPRRPKPQSPPTASRPTESRPTTVERPTTTEPHRAPHTASPTGDVPAATAPLLVLDRIYHYYGSPPTRRGSIRTGPATVSNGVRQVVRAVDEVSLTVHDGDAVALVGESGSGKSTLARVVVGALVPTAGTVSLAGTVMATNRTLDQCRAIQLVPQNVRGALNPRRRVGHALRQAQRIHAVGSDRADRDRRSRAILEMVHVTPERLEHRPFELSGGELARIVLARALLVEPQVLILDEPTASLDSNVKASVLEMLDEVRRDLGLALVIITHELATARALSQRVLVLHDGQVVETGPTSTVLSTPGHDHTRSLLASELTT